MIAETPSLCLSDIRIDRWISGELSATSEQELRSHVEGCARCAARVSELTAYRDRFLAARPTLSAPAPAPEPLRDSDVPRRHGHLTVLPGGLGHDHDQDGAGGPKSRVKTAALESGSRPGEPARALPRAARTGRAFWTRAAGGAGLLAAAAALLVFVQTRPGVEPGARHAPGTDTDLGQVHESRSKGSFTLTAFIGRSGAVIEALPGAAVRPEEPVQLVYATTTPGYLAVLGRDGAGTCSVYVADGERAIAMQPGENIQVPNSIVFDDTPGTEMLYAIACPTAFAVAPLKESLERDGTIGKLSMAIQGCQIVEFPLVKDMGGIGDIGNTP